MVSDIKGVEGSRGTGGRSAWEFRNGKWRIGSQGFGGSVSRVSQPQTKYLDEPTDQPKLPSHAAFALALDLDHLREPHDRRRRAGDEQSLLESPTARRPPLAPTFRGKPPHHQEGCRGPLRYDTYRCKRRREPNKK